MAIIDPPFRALPLNEINTPAQEPESRAGVVFDHLGQVVPPEELHKPPPPLPQYRLDVPGRWDASDRRNKSEHETDHMWSWRAWLAADYWAKEDAQVLPSPEEQLERKREINRAAQRKFRDKQRAPNAEAAEALSALTLAKEALRERAAQLLVIKAELLALRASVAAAKARHMRALQQADVQD